MSDQSGKPPARRVELGQYRGEVGAEFDDPLFIAAISRPEELWARPEAELLFVGRNRVGTVRIPLSSGLSRELVVKEFSPRGLVRLKSLVQPSKAARAWRGARALDERDLGTASPAGYLEKRKRGLVERSYFFAARVDGAEEVRGLFRSLQAAELETLLGALAAFLRRCHDEGILHRDLSDGNILVRKGEPNRNSFFLLDTNRIRVRRKLGGFRRAKNLIRLGIPPAFQKFFLSCYFGETPPRKAYWTWYRLNKTVFTSYLSMKKKLRLRRMARFLRIQ
jgi:tRNA A-37 threonylcarbamoyl transferase component Bud32